MYHSHTGAEAIPSKLDLKGAWPGLSYCIIEVLESRAVQATSWTLREEGVDFVQEEVEIRNATP